MSNTTVANVLHAIAARLLSINPGGSFIAIVGWAAAVLDQVRGIGQ